MNRRHTPSPWLQTMIWIFCLIGLALLPSTHSAGAELEQLIPTELAGQLENNLQALSPISTRWTVQRTAAMPLRKLFTIVKYPWESAGEAFLTERTGYLRYDTKKLYRRFEYSVPLVQGTLTGSLSDPSAPNTGIKPRRSSRTPTIASYDTQVTEVACDAQDLYTGVFRGDEEVGLVIRPVNEAASNYPLNAHDDTWNSDYWRYAGYRMPKLPADFLLISPLRHEVLYWASQPGATVTISKELIDGATCTVVDIKEQTGGFRYHLDEKLGWAVRRRQHSDPNGRVISTAHLRNFIQLDQTAVWLPMECTVEHHIWALTKLPNPPAEEALFSEIYKVVEVSQEPIPAEAFVLNYNTPGVAIRDFRLESKDGVSYEVPADSRDLDAVIESARHGKAFTPSRLSESSISRKWVFFNLVVITFLAGGGLVRWYRSRAQRLA